MKYIDDVNLKDKRVLIRADFNVPIDDSGKIADDNRIRATLPTIKFALESGAKIILCSHLGSPKGKRNEKLSLKPVQARLSELLSQPVQFAPDVVGPKVLESSLALKSGEILLLENLRFFAGEEANDIEFATQLAALCEVYVNDAFATAHRAHASVAEVAKHVPVKVGGFTMKSELEYFAQAFDNPARPLVAIFGGAKISTKMNAIRNVGKRANKIIIGGAMANTFFVADGYGVGKSLYEPSEVSNAKAIKDELETSGCKLLLPVDVVTAPEMKSGMRMQIVPVTSIPADQMALDIGPDSLQIFSAALEDAKTIIWNGPMGAFEIEEFSKGTFGIVDFLSASAALTVVGGGDTDLALHQRHAFDKMSYVSTAGGAFLKLLEGAKLPGVEALN